jgi:hypothetical protein
MITIGVQIQADSCDDCPPSLQYLKLEDGTCPLPDPPCNYAILARRGISTVPSSIVTGNIGISPSAATFIAGFSLSLDDGGQFATSSQVIGEIRAASYGNPIAADLNIAVADLVAAYSAAAALKTADPGRIEFLGGLLNGRTNGPLTLTRGVYTYTTSVSIVGEVTFDGGPDDIFVIQTARMLDLGAGTKILLSGGAQAKNINWQVAGNVRVGQDTHMEGIIHVIGNVIFDFGSSLNGNIYSQDAVVLQRATITADICETDPPTVGKLESGVDLGSACNYVILAKSGITNVPTSSITGNIGVSPITVAAFTGFDLTLDGGGQFATSSQVMGQARGASFGNPIANDLTIAVLDLEAAYLDAASRNHIDESRTNLNNGDISGLVLGRGVYTFTTTISISSDLSFDGGPDDVFILKTTGTLLQAPDTNVTLLGGVQAKNVFWQVAGNVVIGAGAQMQGIILCKSDVVFVTGSSLTGSIYAQTAVALQMATITEAQNTCTTTIVETARNLLHIGRARSELVIDLH